MDTFVFSHNRGRFLNNLMQSLVEADWPGDVTVLDDGSDDPLTVKVLGRIDSWPRVKVVVPERSGTAKYGGFWDNMRFAYEELARSTHVAFLQDDLQFVRRVSERSLSRTIELLDDPRLSPFLSPSFWWGRAGAQRELAGRSEYVEEFDIYHRGASSSQRAFADVTIFNRDRLLAAGWKAGLPETESNAEAMSRFGLMTLHPDPFLAFVPFAPRFRHGRAWTLRMDVRRLPFPARLRMMTEAEGLAFERRDRRVLPVAADHLRVASPWRRVLLSRAEWAS